MERHGASHRPGGSDDPLEVVEAVVRASPLCGTCVAEKADLLSYDREIALQMLVRIGAIRLDVGPCESCRRPGAFGPAA
jgi:hypothetical protein